MCDPDVRVRWWPSREATSSHVLSKRVQRSSVARRNSSVGWSCLPETFLKDDKAEKSSIARRQM